MVVASHGTATILKDDDDDAFNDSSRSSHMYRAINSIVTKNNTIHNSTLGYQRASEAISEVLHDSGHDAATEDHYKILAEFADEGYGLPETNEEVQVRIDAESFHTTVGCSISLFYFLFLSSCPFSRDGSR